jgi:hypothetical protein
MTVYVMKWKDEAFQNLRHYTELAQNVSGKRLKSFQVDNGGEFISNEMKMWCA